MNKLLTMSEVAQHLKVKSSRPTQTILIYLRGIEKSQNCRLLIEKNKRYFTTLPMLKSALPQLFEEDVYTQESISTLKRQITILQNQVFALTNRLITIEELCSPFKTSKTK